MPEEAQLRGHEKVQTREKNTPMRRWEAPFVEAFGVDWKQCVMADDGAWWHGSRWDFVRSILKNYKIRMTSRRRSDWQAELSRKSVAKASQKRAGTGNDTADGTRTCGHRRTWCS